VAICQEAAPDSEIRKALARTRIERMDSQLIWQLISAKLRYRGT